ncbi:hypothetical protein [Bacillus sp. AK128]
MLKFITRSLIVLSFILLLFIPNQASANSDSYTSYSYSNSYDFSFSNLYSFLSKIFIDEDQYISGTSYWDRDTNYDRDWWDHHDDNKDWDWGWKWGYKDWDEKDWEDYWKDRKDRDEDKEYDCERNKYGKCLTSAEIWKKYYCWPWYKW